MSRGTITPATPLPVTGFAIEDTSQCLPAQGATETPGRPVRGDDEAVIAAGPLTEAHREMFGNCGWALALADWERRCGVGRRSGRRQGRQGRRWWLHGGGWTPTITPALLASAHLAGHAGPPGSAGLPASPASCLGAANVGAVTALGMGRVIETLAALEQAAPATAGRCRGGRVLSAGSTNGILRGTQGSWRSRRSSLGGESLLPPRRFYLDTTTLQSNASCRQTPGDEPRPAEVTRSGVGEGKDGPTLRPMSTNIGLAGHRPMKWPTS